MIMVTILWTGFTFHVKANVSNAKLNNSYKILANSSSSNNSGVKTWQSLHSLYSDQGTVIKAYYKIEYGTVYILWTNIDKCSDITVTYSFEFEEMDASENWSYRTIPAAKILIPRGGEAKNSFSAGLNYSNDYSQERVRNIKVIPNSKVEWGNKSGEAGCEESSFLPDDFFPFEDTYKIQKGAYNINFYPVVVNPDNCRTMRIYYQLGWEEQKESGEWKTNASAWRGSASVYPGQKTTLSFSTSYDVVEMRNLEITVIDVKWEASSSCSQ
jgi:hypothetical protein